MYEQQNYPSTYYQPDVGNMIIDETLAKDCMKDLQIVGWTLRHLPKIVGRACKLLVGHSDTCQRLYEGPANCWLDTHRRITLENQS
jgi:hypothetical protein